MSIVPDKDRFAVPDTPAPYVPDAAGADTDSVRRELKTALAAAEANGDTDEIARLREKLTSAAAVRRAAAENTADVDTARRTPPAGRSGKPRQTTES